MTLDICPLTGDALAEALPELARLRIAVFRDWPYLYDGDPDYERGYLRAYADSADAIVVGAWADGRLVGAATAAPMEDHAAEFARPFRERSWELGEILYLGESVLLPEFRGRGAGHAFFEEREAHGRALGRRAAAFCGVVREADDPRRPEGYAPLDGFWRRRGYERLEGVTARFSWRETGAEAESEHLMQFWMRRL